MSDKILKLSQAQTLYQDLRERINALPTSEDLTGLIDDTAGSGDIDKVWSADKVNDTLQLKADKNNSVFTGSISRGRASGTTTGNQSIVLGYDAEASGAFAYATGAFTKAAGNISYTEGLNTEANGESSHASGYGTIANGKLSTVSGMNNVPDDFSNIVEWVSGTAYSKGDLVKITGSSATKTYMSKTDNNIFDPEGQNDGWTTVNVMKFANIVGNGVNSTYKSNAFALDWNGNGYFNGAVYVGCNSDSTGGTKLPSDIQVNGTSVVNDGIANIPLATSSSVGVVKTDMAYGTSLASGAAMCIVSATAAQIKGSNGAYRPIVPNSQDQSVFYGLAKAAGDSTQSASNNAVGTYTDTAKQKIQNMLGITNILSTEESSTATATHAINSIFMMDGKLHRTTSAITIGDAVVVGTNCEIVKADEVFVKNTDIPVEYGTGIGSLQTKSFTYNNNVFSSTASGVGATAIGISTQASGICSHSEGDSTIASGPASHSEGILTTASNAAAHAEGSGTIASGAYAHAEGAEGTASGLGSHAEGFQTTASNTGTHAEGFGSVASGYGSHAEGFSSVAAGRASHVEGYVTIASGQATHVIGQYNVDLNAGTAANDKGTYVEIIGNGTADNARSNAYALDWTGTAHYAGDVYVGCNANSSGGTKVATVNDLSNKEDKTVIVTITRTQNQNETVYTADKTFAQIAAAIEAGKTVIATTNYSGWHIYYKLADYGFEESYPELSFIRFSHESGQDAVYLDIKYDNTIEYSSMILSILQNIVINGTSITTNDGTANIPAASTDTFGVIKIGNGLGINSSNGKLQVNSSSSANVKIGTDGYAPIVPGHQHESVFYGLSKAAGVDLANENVTVGTYPETSKVAIRNMIGATSNKVIAVQDEQPTDSDTKIWLPETESTGIEVPTYTEFQALDAAVVKKTDIASSSTAGIVSVSSTYGVQMITNSNNLAIQMASTAEIKAGSNYYKPIVPNSEHTAVYYGLSKAAGVDLASETVTVGTYPATASTAIRSMLGAVGDVQVNGTSVVSNGVANIPLAGTNTQGCVRIWDGGGIGRWDALGNIYIICADSSTIKGGTHARKAIVPSNQHESVFYGLAKAAGDTTMASSSNEVGTYTTEAKAAIHTMLGIDPASIAAQVDIPLVETVSGTTPTITGQPNVRYICGEVSTISITPPASGSVDVIFESGSTATTMTVPSTVKWPAWFDAEALEANTTYEVLITDGIYGSVMTWAT